MNDAAGEIERKFHEIKNGLDAIGEAMKPFLEVKHLSFEKGRSITRTFPDPIFSI